MMKAAMLLALVSPALAIDNGIGLTPPMGWRSWNCYHGSVTQKLMEAVMFKMAQKRDVGGKQVSIADLGYINVGLDDNWQACGKGVNNSFHDINGNPLVNEATFPSMKNMTDYGHSLNLRVGWYMNNCICKETQFHDPTYITKLMERSAAAVAEAGFDGVKLDSCSEFNNLTWWGELLNATGRPMMIENCHQGGTVPGQTTGNAPCTGTTMPSNCPYNLYRTSGDIRNNWGSMFGNLQSTIPYQGEVPLSRPGSWAYPDMLEVGNMKDFNEDRAHFGAWCIVSAPLILGYDVTNDTTTGRVWDIISNMEAVAVNQAWVGHPGRLVHSEGSSSSPTTQLWAKPTSATSTAAFVINNDENNSHTVTIQMTDLGFTATQQVAVRDIWNHKDLGTTTGSFATDSVVGHDSRFYSFSTN